jgi:hypothetical protein
MTALLIAVGAFLAIAGMLDLIARAAPSAFAQMPRVRAARKRFSDIQLRGKSALDSVVELKRLRDGFIDETMLIEARLRDAKTRAAAFAAGRSIFVHEIGRNGPEKKLYEAYVTNRLIGNPNLPANLERINPIYASPQLVEIWADDLTEATQTIERTYPKTDGFFVEFVGQTVEAVIAKPGS